MSQEVTVNPVVAAIDVVQNAIDFGALSDYMKTNYKKEVVFLNAQDYTEAGSRSSKADSKLGNKTKHDANQSIVRAIKQKIDGDLGKILETKKKAYAQLEKARNSSKSGKKSRNQNPEEYRLSQPFEGRIDILYIILNYPYLPRQLTALCEGGVDLNVFLSIIPKEGAQEVEYQRKAQEKSARVQQKKTTIQGSEIDYTNNPNCYPPARWTSLRPSASSHIAFEAISAADDIETTFKNIEEKLIQITKAREAFSEFFKEKSLVNLPIVSLGCSLEGFLEYMSERQGDFIDALYYELKLHGFKTAMPVPPPPINEQYSSLFNSGLSELDRKVVFLEPHELSDIDFSFELPSSLYSLIYRLINWTLKKENIEACTALSNFLGTPANFYAYAGQKFDSIVQMVNKKYQLGLPLAFFDWQQWNYSTEYLQIGDPLIDALHSADVIETFFDEPLGILWVLTLPPVPKTMGQFMSHYSMPQTIDGITEYISRLYDNKNIGNEKKLRSPPSPAQIVRDKLDFSVLLPSLFQRMNDSSSYYRLPISVANSASFSAPYFFECGLKMVIQRELVNEKMIFKYNAFYKQLFEVFANSLSITIQPIEGIRIMYERPFAVTILFNEQSIRYDPNGIIVKSTGDYPILITHDGAFMMNDKNNQQMIVHPNGTISRFVNGRWRSVDCEGESFIHTPDGLVKENVRHSEIIDLNTRMKSMIRPDQTEYYIKTDGTRRILFSVDFSIEHSPENDKQPGGRSIFDIPNFPVLQKEGEQVSISLDRFDMKFNGKTVKITCPDYSISIDEENVSISDKETEMCLTPNRCEFKHNDKVMVADENGIEKMCQLGIDVSGKKKVESYETHWGVAVPIKETLTEPQQIALYKQFVPRFFAIRSDQTASEFVRGDVINSDGCKSYRDALAHPTGEECQIISYHHPTRPSVVYLEKTPLSKAERANILKGLHVPKPKKEKTSKQSQASSANAARSAEEIAFAEEEAISNAESCRQAFYCDNKLFVQAMNSWLEKRHLQYQEESKPIEETEAEVLHLPPPTPAPRILEKQANLYEKELDEYPKGSVPNYWDSREAEFAMPLDEPKNLERELSPRVKLCDPPRFYKEDKMFMDQSYYNMYGENNLNENNGENNNNNNNNNGSSRIGSNSRQISRSLPSLSSKPTNSTSRPVTVKANPEIINFGNVKKNERAIIQQVVTNMGNVPLHYLITQTNNEKVKVLSFPGETHKNKEKATIPRVVFPGLKITLKIVLEPIATPQIVTTSFQLRTKQFDMTIPVTANIIE